MAPSRARSQRPTERVGSFVGSTCTTTTEHRTRILRLVPSLGLTAAVFRCLSIVHVGSAKAEDDSIAVSQGPDRARLTNAHLSSSSAKKLPPASWASGNSGDGINGWSHGVAHSTSPSKHAVELGTTDAGGIAWKFASRGLQLFMAALQEASSVSRPSATSAVRPGDKRDDITENGESALARSLYIHGLTYLLRALPGELTMDERTSIKAALPSPMQNNDRQSCRGDQISFNGRDAPLSRIEKSDKSQRWRFSWPFPYGGATEVDSRNESVYRPPERRCCTCSCSSTSTDFGMAPARPSSRASRLGSPPILHQFVAALTFHILLLIHAVLPFLLLAARALWQSKRVHQASVAVARKAANAAETIGRVGGKAGQQVLAGALEGGKAIDSGPNASESMSRGVGFEPEGPLGYTLRNAVAWCVSVIGGGIYHGIAEGLGSSRVGNPADDGYCRCEGSENSEWQYF